MKAGFAASQNLNELTPESQDLFQVARQVAHDIRSPLSTLTVLSRSFEQLPEESRVLVQAAIQRITDIANDLLEQSKSGKAALEARKTQEKLVPLIQQVIDEKRVILSGQNRIQIALDITEACEGVCQVNRGDLQRVLSNLLNNAIEAFDCQNGLILVKVESKTECIEIEISDNGKGIPGEVLKDLGQQEVSFGKNQAGHGIGVMSAKAFIESFGGKMQILSRLGQGTTVRLSLPRNK